MSDIIVDDSLGVDRMDYLLLDSFHIGVAYGKFDHVRLMGCLRLLVYNNKTGEKDHPALGIELGGTHAAEAMSLARYYMYQQVYFHQTRRVYDLHLVDFLSEWLEGGYFPENIDEYLNFTDNEVNSVLVHASLCRGNGWEHAERILRRSHFRLVHKQKLIDHDVEKGHRKLMIQELESLFSKDQIKVDYYREMSKVREFPVLLRDGTVESSVNLSKLLLTLPIASVFYVFAHDCIYEKVKKWMEANKEKFSPVQKKKES